MKVAVWAIVAIAPFTVAAADAPTAAVRSLVDRFEAARLRHDPAALAATLAPDYEEISPVGEVDSRDEVLGFYAPALKRPAPPMTSDEVAVRARGTLAVVTMRKSFALPGSAPRSVRVRYVARRAAGAWRLVSAQYTPIPPAKVG